ncbi:MAG TPA: ABC transporter permease [Cyclobacteriaceae bacterium]|jgi:lipopolysaccharide transport system permease protein|nr:ABC transporter permease [Cyclobacteriaceae bacterium]
MVKYHIRIAPNSGFKNYWKDVWQFRELFLILAWRDISVKYKQTLFGFLWAFVRPLLTMLIFVFLFGRVAKLPVDGDAPYAIVVMAGMLPWMLFSGALGEASMSLVVNANLISKVYFPRLVVPMSSIITSLIDFGISMILSIAIFIFYSFVPSVNVIFLPLFIVLALLASIGPSLWIAALNVRYRDFRYVIPFIVQFGLYVSPVGFSSSVIPEKWKLLYSLNPMVAVIDGFRWCLIGQGEIYLPGFFLGMGVILIFLLLGYRKFRRTEKIFADLV